MVDEVRRLIKARVAKRAKFRRDGAGKKPQLADSWRRPRGGHHKQRRQKKAKGALPTPGFGSPLAVRGMHPSGFEEVLIQTPAMLEGLDPTIQRVRIGGAVGGRKRAVIQEQAEKAGLKILNLRKVKETVVEPTTEEEGGDNE